MTHMPNAITHTPEYTVLHGVVRHTFIIFGLFTTPNLYPWHKILATPLGLCCYHKSKETFILKLKNRITTLKLLLVLKKNVIS